MKNSMKDFYTRSAASIGIQVPLSLPDGSLTDDWLQIRGTDSDEFQRADLNAKRMALTIAGMEDETAREEAIELQKRKIIASLVAGWSFPEECNEENILEFLKEAPQIADLVDRIARNRAVIFAKKPNSSSSTPKPNSSSKRPQKARKSP